MTPGEFRRIRDLLELSQAQMATKLGVNADRSIRGYEKGEHIIPGPVRILSRVLVQQLISGYNPNAPVGPRS